MEVVDKSGQPRCDEEIEEAKKAIDKELVSGSIIIPLMIHFPAIIEALEELLLMRKIIKKGMSR